MAWRASCRNSAKVFAGCEACTMTVSGVNPKGATAVNALIASYGVGLRMCGAMECESAVP
ncbi:hypothetical protein D3C71_2092890 [compost metagenome]